MALPHVLIRQGSVLGHSHRRLGINNQDSLCVEQYLLNGTQYSLAVVSDGCTGTDKRRSRTDVGSCLLAQYAVSESRHLLCAETPLEAVPDALYPRCVSYLGQLARLTRGGDPKEQWEFIERHLLATLNGLITDGRTLVFFSAGDGVQILDDECELIDQDNRPFYPAFHQVDRSILGATHAELPISFDKRIYTLNARSRFAIATDGIIQRNGAKQQFVATQDIEGIFMYQENAPAGLQWWLNKQSNESGRFGDDCTIVTGRLSYEEAGRGCEFK